MYKTSECYQDYVAIKLHFSGSYDYQKYNGKTRIKGKNLTEVQLYIFKKISSKYSRELIVYYFARKFYENPKFWIISQPVDRITKELNELKSFFESFEYKVTQELDKLINEGMAELGDKGQIKDLFTTTDNSFCFIAKKLIANEVSLELFYVLNDTFNLLSVWEKYLKKDLIFKDILIKFNNFKPFGVSMIVSDPNKYKTTIKTIIS